MLGGVSEPTVAADRRRARARLRRPGRARGRAGERPATCPTRGWPPPPTWPWSCTGRCSSRARPGVGKTALAHALAEVTGRPIYRLQCYEGLEASQALYDWDFGRQLLHLRAAEAGARQPTTPSALEASLYDRRFLLARPLLQALEDSPSVLLVDEVDRADDEFEAFLLEVLSDFTISIPELGTVRAITPPLVVLTSNRTREVHDALKRRCLYHWLRAPRLRPRGRDPAPPAARR